MFSFLSSLCFCSSSFFFSILISTSFCFSFCFNNFCLQPTGANSGLCRKERGLLEGFRIAHGIKGRPEDFTVLIQGGFLVPDADVSLPGNSTTGSLLLPLSVPCMAHLSNSRMGEGTQLRSYACPLDEGRRDTSWGSPTGWWGRAGFTAAFQERE